MPLFTESKPVPPVPELTTEIAAEIYAAFKGGADHTQIHSAGHHPVHVNAVYNEIKRLENEVTAKMQGQWVLVPAAVDPETGVTIPAEVFEATSRAQLEASLESDILNVVTVVGDIMVYSDGSPHTPVTWAEFAASFEGSE